MNDQIEIKDLDQEIPLQEDWLVFQKDSNRIVYKAPKSDVEGEDAYVYIAYADDEDGNGFTNTFSETKDYVAVKSTNTEIPAPVASDFAGLWKNYKGAKGDDGDAATATAGTTTTLNAGQSAKVTNVGTTSAAVFKFEIPKGDKGDDGAKIVTAEFVGNDIHFNLDDGTEAILVGAKTDLKGATGNTGASVVGAEVSGDDIVFTKSDGTTIKIENILIELKGETGNGIATIEKTDTTGLVDTYTITYDDETTKDLTVTNGEDGEDAYVYIAYASDDSGTDFTTTFNSELDYIAILSTDTEIPTPQASDFAGLWKNYKGRVGDAGDDAYVYIAYASDVSGSDFAIGIGSWDISTATYDDVFFSVETEEGIPWSMFFRTDGSKMYVLGNDNDTVYQYSLSTPWDLSTASYDSVSFSVVSEDIKPHCIFFKSDGTKLYTTGEDNSSVYQYTLSTPWDLSTASYDSISFSTASQDENPWGLFLKADGTKMYVGGTNGYVYQYTLSTPWDLSTASYDSISFSTNSQTTFTQNIFFKTDGRKMYIASEINPSVYQYTLSTPWDLSTASYDSISLSPIYYENKPRCVSFNPDGSKMYVAMLIRETSSSLYIKRILQYSLTTQNLEYIAILSTDTEIPAPDADDFAGLWTKYKGDAGTDGKSFEWKDVYIAETTYHPDDVVFYGGSSYICTAETTGNLPTDTDYWDLMAQSGDMLASVYDPKIVAGDAFDMDNMVEGTNNKLVSSAEKTAWNDKLDDITGESIADLSDVDSIAGITNGKVLKWDTNKFVVADDDDTTYTASDFDIKDLTDSTNLRTTWSGKQNALGFTPEDVDNKRTSFQANPDNSHYISEKLAKESLDAKAPIDSPTLTGTVTLPTTQLGESSIKLDASLSADEKWSGITVAGTAGATIAVGDVCYLASTGKWLLNDGILDGTDTGFSKQLGICLLAANDTDATEILLYGKVRSAAFPAFTVGSPVFLDDTAGDLTVTSPSTTNFAVRIVGFALSAEELMFNPSNDWAVNK